MSHSEVGAGQLQDDNTKRAHTPLQNEPCVPAQTFSKLWEWPSPCLIGDVWGGGQCTSTMMLCGPMRRWGRWGGWGVRRLIKGWVTKPDQIKMWREANMADWVLQYCSSVGPIMHSVSVSKMTLAAAAHVSMDILYNQMKSGLIVAKMSSGQSWSLLDLHEDWNNLQHTGGKMQERVSIFNRLKNLQPLPSVQGNERERDWGPLRRGQNPRRGGSRRTRVWGSLWEASPRLVTLN